MSNIEPLSDIISLEYIGPAVEAGEMDAYKVARNITAFSNFLSIVSRSAYGKESKFSSQIKGFRGESFDIDFIINVVGIAGGLYSSVGSPEDFFNIVKESLGAIKFLNGKRPTSVKQVEGSNAETVLQIENVEGDVIIVNNKVVEIINDDRTTKETERFLRDPLKSGIDRVELRSKIGNLKATIDKTEAESFARVDGDEDQEETEITTSLLIESVGFKENLKWRFFDGQIHFPADMQDEMFQSLVKEGESFRKGDELRVKMVIKQSGTGETLTTERSIVKVLRHKSGQKQKRLWEE